MFSTTLTCFLTFPDYPLILPCSKLLINYNNTVIMKAGVYYNVTANNFLVDKRGNTIIDFVQTFNIICCSLTMLSSLLRCCGSLQS